MSEKKEKHMPAKKHCNFTIVQQVRLLSEEALKAALSDLSLKFGGAFLYAYVLHDKDVYSKEDEKKDPAHKCGENKEPHFHIILKLGEQNARTFDFVAKIFGVPTHMVKRIERSESGAFTYLTHEKETGKALYSEDMVHSNFDWKSYRDKELEKAESAKSKNSEKKQLENFCNAIANGEIKRYELTSKIPLMLYVKQKPELERAFSYRAEALSLNPSRDMKVIYVHGDAGVGKTIWALSRAQEKNYHVYVSASGSDFMSNYLGQECIILDDVRPSTMSSDTLLKLTDNNTGSMVKSRYYNKSIAECKLLIITSIMGIDEFFGSTYSEGVEPVLQFKRRCKTYIRFLPDTIATYVFNYEKRKYEACNVIPNNTLANLHIEREVIDDAYKDAVIADLFPDAEPKKKGDTAETLKCAYLSLTEGIGDILELTDDDFEKLAKQGTTTEYLNFMVFKEFHSISHSS